MELLREASKPLANASYGLRRHDAAFDDEPRLVAHRPPIVLPLTYIASR
jgi:hypothetical protein